MPDNPKASPDFTSNLAQRTPEVPYINNFKEIARTARELSQDFILDLEGVQFNEDLVEDLTSYAHDVLTGGDLIERFLGSTQNRTHFITSDIADVILMRAKVRLKNSSLDSVQIRALYEQLCIQICSLLNKAGLKCNYSKDLVYSRQLHEILITKTEQ